MSDYDARLMQKLKIPVTLDVKKAAVHGTRYEGYTPLKTLKRFTEGLTSDEGDVDVVLQTGVDEQGLSFLKGEVKSTVSSICQRCNEQMNIDLHTDFAYTPVRQGYEEDEDNPLPDYYDTIEINEFGEVSLKELIEDELILAMPIIPKHEIDQCGVSEQDMSFGHIDEEIIEEKPNPFAVLQQLKRN